MGHRRRRWCRSRLEAPQSTSSWSLSSVRASQSSRMIPPAGPSRSNPPRHPPWYAPGLLMASVSDACMKCTDCTLLHFVEMTCVPAMRLKALLSLKIDIDLGALGLELPQQMPMKDAKEGCQRRMPMKAASLQMPTTIQANHASTACPSHHLSTMCLSHLMLNQSMSLGYHEVEKGSVREQMMLPAPTR